MNFWCSIGIGPDTAWVLAEELGCRGARHAEDGFLVDPGSKRSPPPILQQPPVMGWDGLGEHCGGVAESESSRHKEKVFLDPTICTSNLSAQRQHNISTGQFEIYHLGYVLCGSKTFLWLSAIQPQHTAAPPPPPSEEPPPPFVRGRDRMPPPRVLLNNSASPWGGGLTPPTHPPRTPPPPPAPPPF